MRKAEEKKIHTYNYRQCRALNHQWEPIGLRSSEYLNGHVDERTECLNCGTERLRVLDRRYKVVARYYFYPQDYLVDVPMARSSWTEGYIKFTLGWTD